MAPQNPLQGNLLGRLSALGFDGFADGLSKQQTTAEQRHRSVHDWFDGLKTLQFIRACQDTYGDQSLTHTLANLNLHFGPKSLNFKQITVNRQGL